MSTSGGGGGDQNKPVTGYPYPPPQQPPQQQYNNVNGYPPPPQQNNYHQASPGTGYPYAGAPPAVYYNPNPYPYPAEPYVQRRNTFFRSLIIGMIAIFIIFAVVSFIFWLVFRPEEPQFRVTSVSVTGFNITGTQVSGNWDVGFYVRNPNKKMYVSYEQVEGSVYYRNEFLTETGIAPFGQVTRNETALKAKFAASDTYVPADSINRLNGERSRGVVTFNLRLLSWIRFRSGGWRTRVHSMRVYCDDVAVKFSSNSGVGTLSDARECEVAL